MPLLRGIANCLYDIKNNIKDEGFEKQFIEQCMLGKYLLNPVELYTFNNNQPMFPLDVSVYSISNKVYNFSSMEFRFLPLDFINKLSSNSIPGSESTITCNFENNKIGFVTDGKNIDDLSNFKYKKVTIDLRQNPISNHLKGIINNYNLHSHNEINKLDQNGTNNFYRVILNKIPLSLINMLHFISILSCFYILPGMLYILPAICWEVNQFDIKSLKKFFFDIKSLKKFFIVAPVLSYLIYLFMDKVNSDKVLTQVKPVILVDP